MVQTNNCQFTLREYRSSDKGVVMSLFRDGILEHVYPAFFKAMSHPDHVGIALSISMAGYVLGGSSYFQALLFGSTWSGLIYYCCYEIYQGYMRRRLDADMADIETNYLENPDNGMWLAEADINGRTKVIGMVAVLGKRVDDDEDERFYDHNGGVMGGGPEFSQDTAKRCYGEMSQMSVLFHWRRKNLGSQLMMRALDFCKERGYTHLVLDVSSPQTATASLCQKFGFVQTACHSNTHANRWFSNLARIKATRMEKTV